MKYIEEFQKDFFDKAKSEECEVDGIVFVQNKKDLYISWADKKIESLLKAQKTASNSDYAKCNQPKPSLCEKRKTVVYCTHDRDCTYKHFA